MTYEEALKRVSHCKAPHFKGDIKEVLAKHLGWLCGESWGSKANLSSANLSSANLIYADLRCANLSSANLSHADFRRANLIYADLSYADLRHADLSYSNLSYADLRHADLSYSNLSSAKHNNRTLRHIISYPVAYKYYVLVFIYTSGEVWVRMGCKFKSVGEWGRDWHDNKNKFPIGSTQQKQRMLAYRFAVDSAKLWLDENGHYKQNEAGLC